MVNRAVAVWDLVRLDACLAGGGDERSLVLVPSDAQHEPRLMHLHCPPHSQLHVLPVTAGCLEHGDLCYVLGGMPIQPLPLCALHGFRWVSIATMDLLLSTTDLAASGGDVKFRTKYERGCAIIDEYTFPRLGVGG